MFKNVYAVGLLIFTSIILAFFITNIFFRDVDYYRNSVTLSAFLLPLLFALGALLSVTTYVKHKKRVSFKEAYGRAFIPMFIGGALSLGSIFLYINYVDPDTKDLLNYQYIESFKTALDDEYERGSKVFKPESAEMKDIETKYQQGIERIEAKRQRKEDMFSVKYFLYIFAGYSAYFLLLSLFFGSFFRTRSNT